ncbi:MAG: hypothetical protein R3B59_04475 [Dehalococcoidia bacterium]
MRFTLPRVQGALAALAVTTVLFAACGDDDDPVDDALDEAQDAIPTISVTPPRTATSTATTAGGDGNTVEVTGVDYEFEGLPDTIDAGTRLTFTNDSDEEAHELVAIRLPDGETRPVSELITLPDEELGEIVSTEPATVLIAPPGEDGIAVVGDGTIDEPGRYAVVCFIPVGADPADVLAEPGPDDEGTPAADEEPSGPPHAARGMFAELTVE